VIDANKSEADILMSGDFDQFAKNHADKFAIVHVFSHASENWKGEKGHITENIIKQHAFEPDRNKVALLCGPPMMIQK
jgi:nitrate reductase (NAD(P)H)